MEIIISGRHMEVTAALRAYAQERAEKLTKYFDGITKITVTLASEAGRQSAEMVISASRNLTVIGEVVHRDLYAALDLVTDKMERQLTKHKEKIKSHRVQPPVKYARAGSEQAEQAEQGVEDDEQAPDGSPPAQ